MKNLELEGFGLEEMNKEEMLKVEGGMPWWMWVGFALVAGAALLTDGFGYSK